MKGRWSWAGASIFVLALCLGGGWATALIMSASSRTPPITDSTKDLLSSVGGVLAGAITAYIGGYISQMRHRPGADDAAPKGDVATADPAEVGPEVGPE